MWSGEKGGGGRGSSSDALTPSLENGEFRVGHYFLDKYGFKKKKGVRY